mgnify:CR=1 FL=1
MAVTPGSIAEELELEPGDVLLTIDGEELEDIFDYDYMTDAESFVMVVRKANGEEWELEIESGGEDLGLTFENGLMSDYKSCSNKCIFCFIDQMPPGMRETLYFKDDDSRLSFLQGNYITLTNMKDKDIERIIRFHLAPINISVQTMNPELRCKMLHNRFAGEALKKIDRLYEAGTEMNGQIVLCRGVNDGNELAYTIEQLSKYAPVKMTKLTLQEQMRKAGLVSSKKMAKVQRTAKKSRVQAREAREAVEENKKAQLERDKQLSEQQKQAVLAKEYKAQVKQLIEMNRITVARGDIGFNFTDNNLIKKIMVDKPTQTQLINGRLAIARLAVDNKPEGEYAIIPAVVAEKIAQRDASSIVLHSALSQDEQDEDDPYADFKVPDDLMW